MTGPSAGTVSAMDGATEPPWMGLWRVPADGPVIRPAGSNPRRSVMLSLMPPPDPPMSDSPRIAFLASTTEPAQMARAAMVSRYGDYAPEQADVLCPLGGDGFMLQTLHRHGHLGKPVFGMKLGTVW